MLFAFNKYGRCVIVWWLMVVNSAAVFPEGGFPTMQSVAVVALNVMVSLQLRLAAAPVEFPLGCFGPNLSE